MNTKIKSILLAATGCGIILAGFIYDVIFAGIPYQDPSGEMLASYRYHSTVAATIRWFGLAIFMAGAGLGLSRALVRRFESPAE